MIHSRLTAKSQTTVPVAVRRALGLRPGDDMRYEIDGERVILTRADEPDPFVGNVSTFTEWASEADSVYDVLETQFPSGDAPRL